MNVKITYLNNETYIAVNFKGCRQQDWVAFIDHLVENGHDWITVEVLGF